MGNQDEHIQESPSLVQETESAGAGILIGIIVVALVLVILNYFNILRLYQIVPFLSFLPHKPTMALQVITPSSSPQQNTSLPSTVSNTSINICTDQHTGYPLLSDVLTTKSDPNLGEFIGTVNSIDTTKQTVTVSAKSGSQFSFPVSSQTTVYDIHKARITILSDIAGGTNAVISFPCLQPLNTFITSNIQLTL